MASARPNDGSVVLHRVRACIARPREKTHSSGLISEQLGGWVQWAIFGNAGTFRVGGARDAKILADEFFPEFSIEDLVSLPKLHIYLRLMIAGTMSRGFSGVTLAS